MALKSYPWLKPGLGGAAIGAVGIMILGFWQFGWVMAGKADQMAQERSNAAVAEALAPICAAKFFAQNDAPGKLADLRKLTSDYAPREFVEKGGWSVAVVAKTPNYQLIPECTKKILAEKPA